MYPFSIFRPIMKHKNLVLLIMSFAAATGANGQIQTTNYKGITHLNTTNMEPMVVQTIDGVSTHYYSNDMPGLAGSPYLEEQFQEGTLTVRDGTIVPGLRYRYNIYNDAMQFVLNGDTAVIDKPLAVNSVEIGNRKFVYDVYMTGPDKVATSYFEVVQETDAMTILRRYRIELKQDIYVPNYGGGGGTKEFMMNRKDRFYVKLGKGAAQEIDRKRDFLGMLNVLRDQVKSHMKANRLSVRKEEDLKQIAQYYNDLVFSNF